MKIRIELFVADAAASKDFYQRVLSLAVTAEEANGYVEVSSGAVTLALNPRSVPGAERQGDGPRTGFEIHLIVDDVDQACEQAEAADWPLRTPLKTHPWGATDFRVVDPDGFPIRVTSG